MSRITTTANAHQKPLMPHKIMNFIQWKKCVKRSRIHLLHTVQRHRSISVTSNCVEMVLSTNQWVWVVSLTSVHSSSYAVSWGGMEARRGLAPWKLNRPLVAPPLSAHYDHTTSLKYLVGPYQVKYPLICNKYIRKQPCTV